MFELRREMLYLVAVKYYYIFFVCMINNDYCPIVLLISRNLIYLILF
jgi:hypothetical protein